MEKGGLGEYQGGNQMDFEVVVMGVLLKGM